MLIMKMVIMTAVATGERGDAAAAAGFPFADAVVGVRDVRWSVNGGARGKPGFAPPNARRKHQKRGNNMRPYY